ncbi:hypothetical protein AMS68_000458 [Peltaster fructicola]|uniref:Uncharacterized protein n=1 Tax=Peltaster fructicola TaxID=286661 RepID=A0A6H0XJX0_9PEZI|nr:hypothetical protein AMS68_000458 [Peltaster fructicola]
MLGFRLVVLASAAWQIIGATAQIQEPISTEAELDDQLDDPSKMQSAAINVAISASFPGSEVFGIKVVNGRPTEALLDVVNNEPEAISLLVVGGSLTTPLGKAGSPDPPVIVHNLTGSRFNTQVPAGEKQSFTYTFQTDLQPQDLQLNLGVMLQNSKNTIFQQSVYNGTVTVVDAPISFFEPQVIFLYLTLAAAFGGICFFIYQTWITRLFPQKRRGGKGGERAKRSTGGTKPVDPAAQTAVIGADGPAVTSGSKAYDESWIPAEHLKRPEARRVGSGRPKSRAA